MKKIKLVGRYNQRISRCHFEDIPHFLKMADLRGENDQASSVKVCKVKLGSFVLLRSKVLRWQIFQSKNGDMILAYRPSMEEESYPCIYRIVRNTAIHETVLKNYTSQYSNFERLKMWYDTQKT